MGTWVVPADQLARSRFTVSPLAETVAALTVLSNPDPPRWPSERAFRASHREAYLQMMADDQVRAMLADRLWRPRRGDTPGWMSDHLALPPLGDGASFEDELAQLGRPDGGRVRDAVTDILRWVWTTAVVSDWPRRRRVLEADVVSRTSRLASRGWAGVFATFGRNTRWLGDGRLQVNRYEGPEEDMSRARELSFVPVHASGSWAAWDPPYRFALIYPVSGALADSGPAPGPAALGRLIGPNRARVLRLLDQPRSTTQLTALTGLPPGAVGNHLKVLLDTGIALRRRSGREVLYWRTATGDALVASSTT